MDDPLSAAWKGWCGVTFVIGIDPMSVEESAEVAEIHPFFCFAELLHEFLCQYFDL